MFGGILGIYSKILINIEVKFDKLCENGGQKFGFQQNLTLKVFVNHTYDNKGIHICTHWNGNLPGFHLTHHLGFCHTYS